METAGEHSTVAEMITIAREFAAEQIDPNAAAWERERRLPRETFTASAAQGLCGLLVPAHLGGAQLTVSEMAKVLEPLAYADMAFAFALVPHNNLAGAIAREGSEYDRARYLDALLDGSVLGAFLLTEPGAGSDASALSTTAIAHGESCYSTAKRRGSRTRPRRTCSGSTRRLSRARAPAGSARSSSAPTSPAWCEKRPMRCSARTLPGPAASGFTTSSSKRVSSSAHPVRRSAEPWTQLGWLGLWSPQCASAFFGGVSKRRSAT